jgi:ATP-dependent Clp protease ATP-binding subunit ClpC
LETTGEYFGIKYNSNCYAVTEMNSDWFKSAEELIARWKAQESEPRAPGNKTFTPRALQSIQSAVREAAHFKHHYIGAEHLLLGLLELKNGVAVNILKKYVLNSEVVRLEIENLVGYGANVSLLPRFPYTPRARRVLESASNHAEKLGHTHVGTEHLILGILEESEGAAAKIFDKFSLNSEITLREVLAEITSIYP